MRHQAETAPPQAMMLGEELLHALERERAALLANDVDGLLTAADDKSRLVGKLETIGARLAETRDGQPLLRRIHTLNMANGTLLAARARYASWALTRLRGGATSVYGRNGAAGAAAASRSLARA